MTKPIVISMFNHKGGVGKTTSVYNISYILSQTLGLRVLMVDADPQCNLTGVVLSETFTDSNKAKEFYDETLAKATRQDSPVLTTVGDCFHPLIKDAQTFNIDRADNVVPTQVHRYDKLFLIPGHLDLSEMDHLVELGLAGASLALYRWIPGMLTNFFRRVAEKNKIDIVMFDLSPSLGGLNQSILMGSDYYMVPFFPDFYSFQAVNSLSTKFSQWLKEDSLFQQFSKFPEGDAKHIGANPMFLGGFPQKTRTRKKNNLQVYVPEQAYGAWIKDIYGELDKFVKSLKESFPGGQRGLSRHFTLNKVGGINDFISAGLDVQVSGHPICDQGFAHKHQNNDGGLVKFTKHQNDQKSKTSQSYIKLLGAMFKNMTQTHLDLLGRDFKERVGLYSATSEQTDLSELIPVPQTPVQPYEDNHWYTDDEVNMLLAHYLEHIQGLYLLNGLSANQLNGSTLRDNLNDFKTQRESQELAEGQGNDKVILPINMGGYHWVLMYIRYPEGGAVPEFFYFDPLGQAPDQLLVNRIREVYNDTEVLNLDCRLQTDNCNCGPWIIEAARTLIEKAGLPEPTLDINDARAEHTTITKARTQENNESNKRKRSFSISGSSQTRLRMFSPVESNSSQSDEDDKEEDSEELLTNP